MNFQKVQRKNRKAISPVLATVILIAITLIAAIAIAGFVFGLFGTFTSTAQVSASVTTCTNVVKPICTLTLTNTGNGNTAPTGSCTISIVGTVLQGTFSSTATLVPGTPLVGATCTANTALAAAPGDGLAVSGSVGLTNGGSVLFSGSTS